MELTCLILVTNYPLILCSTGIILYRTPIEISNCTFYISFCWLYAIIVLLIYSYNHRLFIADNKNDTIALFGKKKISVGSI